MSEVGEKLRTLVHTLSRVEYLETQIDEMKNELVDRYETLVKTCPHADVIDHKWNIRGWGTWRICKTCGLEDRAQIGGTPGDEYNYGTPGHIDKNFWEGAHVEIAKNENEFKKYRKNHYWQVENGAPVSRY